MERNRSFLSHIYVKPPWRGPLIPTVKTSNREGFSLFGVIIALAVVSILAATLVPAAFRQLMRQRETETSRELLLIEAGLVGFYEDVGRFPTDAEGLAALITDPGAGGWGGPYVAFAHEDPVVQVENDAWNLSYQYDTNPTTSPANAADVLVVSGGINRLIDAGTVGGTWTMSGQDDLMGVVVADLANREKLAVAKVEQERLANAVQAYFHDNQSYPATLTQINTDYLDEGVGSDALYDQWNRSYILTPANFSVPALCTITSRGPDGVLGGGDDVVMNVNSVIPGRKHSYYELAITQAVVDAQSGVTLTGDWTADYSLFSLASVLQTDGWGNPYEEQMSTRIILSAGPDADYFTPDDNIPPGVVPDDVSSLITDIIYVEDSADMEDGNCQDVHFEIKNDTNKMIWLTSMTISWTGMEAYFIEVKIDGDEVAKDQEPLLSSGQLLEFSKIKIKKGKTKLVEIKDFEDALDASGQPVGKIGRASCRERV